jgi:iron-sulfur cluster repair protein YtfE (RIC family)
MERWDEEIRRDHEGLKSQLDALGAVLQVEAVPEDQRGLLVEVFRPLRTTLEVHLVKEEEVLFPAFMELSGGEERALILLQDEHQQLRVAASRLGVLLENPESSDWDTLTRESQFFIRLLEDHEAKESRLLMDLLEYGLEPEQLMCLAQEFSQAYRPISAQFGGAP